MSENSIVSRSKLVKAFLISATIAGFVLLLFANKESRAGAWSTLPTNQAEQQLAVSLDDPGATVEIQLIKITRFGFEPREIERSRGAFVLAVHNFSSEPDLVLQLHRVQGSRLQEFRMRRGTKKWQAPLSLPPGDYVLTEASNPEWQCQIKINN